MCTILDTTQLTIAESELSLKYWIDVVKTVVYVQNFILSAKQYLLNSRLENDKIYLTLEL